MEVLQRTANRGSISTGYDIDNSVKLEHANNEWFYNASPTAGNRKTYTFSFWVKRTEIGTVNASGNQYVIGQGQHGRMYFGGDFFQYRFDDGHDCRNVSRKFRDTSAWYHFVVAVDTNQLTSSNRVKLYVNGESLAVDDHDGGSFPDLADEGAFFSTSYLTLGTAPFGGSFNVGDGDYDMSGYLSEFCAVDGQQLTPTDFGEFDSDSGIWKPIDVSGLTFGSEGFYLNFATAGDLGDDKSGNGNDLTENNLAAADQATDTSTNNFCTLNVLNNEYLTITEGATKSVESTNSAWYGCTTTIGVNNGKWYSEGKAIAIGTGIFFGVTPFNGTADASIGTGSSVFPGNVADTIGYWDGGGGQVYRDNSVVTTIGAFVANDIIGIALDMDNGYVYFAKNGTWLNSGDPTSGATGTGGFSLLNPTETHGFAYGVRNSTAGINFGGYTINTISSAATDANGYGTFEYAPPTGYYALCTKNLAEFG
jgi:hypothetical protein